MNSSQLAAMWRKSPARVLRAFAKDLGGIALIRMAQLLVLAYTWTALGVIG